MAGSMGAYAAIKFSQLFGITVSLAMHPQWSIDKAECNGFNPGYEMYFEPAMAGMGIRQNEVNGKVFLFLDRFQTSDVVHAAVITNVYPGTVTINVPMGGHHLLTLFAERKSSSI